MLYDNDDYLSGLDQNAHEIGLVDLDPYVHRYYDFAVAREDYEPTSLLGADTESLRHVPICPCDIDDEKCKEAFNTNPYIPKGNPFPPKLVISYIWDTANKACNITEKLDIYPNNDCLNERFGRSYEPAGSDKCRTYYFWGLEVKSRPCMIKNAQPEELDKYEICGKYDDAFLCTKDSVIYKQKLKEEVELRHQQEEAAKKSAEAEKEKAQQILNSNEALLALAMELKNQESDQIDPCMKNHECYSIAKKNDTKCETYNILDIKVKSRTCIEKFATKEELNLYENCSFHGSFVCLKGEYDKYKYARDLFCKVINCLR